MMKIMDSHNASQKIPVTILTGFLGSGKTTILNHLLTTHDMTGVALLINEFGQIGIDHHLVESADETTMLLDSGCICCTIQGGVVDALKRLFDRAIKREIPPITRILIETTGLADPVPVVQTIMQEPFVAARFVCDGVVTVVEATLQPQDLEQFQEAMQQISSADKVLISKVDLSHAQHLAIIKQYIQRLNPEVTMLEVQQGKISLSDFMARGIYDKNSVAQMDQWMAYQQVQPINRIVQPAAKSVLQHGQVTHQSAVGTISFRFSEPLPWLQFTLAMGKIIANLQKRLLRCKGIIQVAGGNRPIVIHAVRGEVFPALQLETCTAVSPSIHDHGRLVFIIHHLQQQDIDLIQQYLTHLGTVSAALKQTKLHPFLPTRSWLKQRIHWTAPLIEHESWLIQGKQLMKQPMNV
ncbi:CobW family GTP-binding protein [Acinetobacter baumannii]|uniref:CobW family GTP-binding protein n=1 Tax=Acinetobacter baumannii TaxID=470 RepID=UPI002940AB85|nr:GTP-binding protein [Acinetobacter baumannii]MDV4325191.1 GTP-binding protein [Acinetobacter baumannii]